MVKQVSTKAFKPTAKTLGRNTVINFVGQVLVASSAIIIVPLIVKSLGYTAYGLLSLAMMVFGSFSLLELGLGRATTKFVAEYLHSNSYEKICSVVLTSLAFQILLGISGGIVLWLLASTISRNINLQPSLIPQAENMFRILAFSAPLILASSCLRGALEGAQRFDLVNYVKIFLNLSTYLIPLLGAHFQLNVPNIVLCMLASRFIATITYFICTIYTLPQIRRLHLFKYCKLKPLISYAGWVSISNFIVPFLVQIDRYLIASMVTVSALTFYTVPFEILNGLWIIPSSIASVLFPAFSSFNGEDETILNLFQRPIKYLIITLGPVVVFFFVFARDILIRWQGLIIADNSTLVLQILVLGVLINSISWVPSNFIMGTGRPDLTTKIHLIQTPIYLVTVYYFVLEWGVIGAAVAFTLRVTLETILTFYAAFHINPIFRRTFIASVIPSCISLLILFLILYYVNLWLPSHISYTILASLSIYTLYYSAVWLLLLDKYDKSFVTTFFPVSICINRKLKFRKLKGVNSV